MAFLYYLLPLEWDLVVHIFQVILLFHVSCWIYKIYKIVHNFSSLLVSVESILMPLSYFWHRQFVSSLFFFLFLARCLWIFTLFIGFIFQIGFLHYLFSILLIAILFLNINHFFLVNLGFFCSSLLSKVESEVVSLNRFSFLIKAFSAINLH